MTDISCITGGTYVGCLAYADNIILLIICIIPSYA